MSRDFRQLTLSVFERIPTTRENVLQALLKIQQTSKIPAGDFMDYLNNMLEDSTQHAFIIYACTFIYNQPSDKFPLGFFDFIVKAAKQTENDTIKSSFDKANNTHRWVIHYQAARALHNACAENEKLPQSSCCGFLTSDAAKTLTTLTMALQLLSNNSEVNETNRKAIQALQERTNPQNALHSALTFVLLPQHTQHQYADENENPLTTAPQ